VRIFLCIDELVPHFGPGMLLVTVATALRCHGERVVVFVERAVPADNQYVAALRAAEIDVRVPGRAARAADSCSRLDHLLLAALLPVRLPLAFADMAYRRRTFARSWQGVRGRLNRILPTGQLCRPLRWLMRAKLSREHRREPAALAHMMTGNGAAFAWAARRAVPIVYNENIVPTDAHGVDWWVDVRRHVAHVDLTASLCAAATPAIRTFLGYRGPIAVVPSSITDPLANGADGAARDPALGATVVIGSAARLSTVKGFDVLLRALHRILDDGGDRRPVQLWIAGDGPERTALEQLAQRLGVAAHVRFLGHCGPAEMAQFWAAIDLFALASRWEGLPYVILEAMARGKPVVATAVDGVPEAVIDGDTGLLVPPDAAAPLADALLGLVEDGGRRASMGRAGRARFVSTFRSDVVVEQLMAAYRQVVSNAAH
jgi:glycosyltransferase involved in cell wall biosynthesis